MPGKGSTIATGRKSLAEKQARRNFRLLNKVAHIDVGEESIIDRTRDLIAGINPLKKRK